MELLSSADTAKCKAFVEKFYDSLNTVYSIMSLYQPDFTHDLENISLILTTFTPIVEAADILIDDLQGKEYDWFDEKIYGRLMNIKQGLIELRDKTKYEEKGACAKRILQSIKILMHVFEKSLET